MKKYAFGVDIGGTTEWLFQMNGEVLEVWKIPTVTEDKERYPSRILQSP